jgi:hypothetical protein
VNVSLVVIVGRSFERPYGDDRRTGDMDNIDGDGRGTGDIDNIDGGNRRIGDIDNINGDD